MCNLYSVTTSKQAIRELAKTMGEWRGTKAGFLANLVGSDGSTQMIYLNPVISRHLLRTLFSAARNSDWWGEDLEFKTREK